MKQPKETHSIWDNGGETYDRYTVVLTGGTRTFSDCLCVSDNPAHPCGFSQISTCAVGPHLGQQVDWRDLPERIQQHVSARLGV